MMWDVGLKSLQDRACRIANRNLTFDEWKQYMSDEPYRLTCPELPVDPGFIKAGRDLAEDGDMDGAVRIFKRAKELDSHADLDPMREATKWKFFGEGLNLAKRGDVEDAVKLFRAADDLDPQLVPDPIPYANKLAASSQVAEGKRLITLGEVKGALAAYAQAKKFDSAEISAESWNELCWFGSLRGYAHDVMDACEQAVMHDPENALIRDSRGLARALTGNVDGAIKDFQALIAWADKQPNSERLVVSRERRARWIDDLRKGLNPFTPEELELLKRE
jgi:tetratricopeptide (TPR) repeat protein